MESLFISKNFNSTADNDPGHYGESASFQREANPDCDSLASNLKSVKETDNTEANKKKLKKGTHKLVVNVSVCKYEVVRHVTKKMLKWQTSIDPEEECDVWWTDGAVDPEFLGRMKSFQKVNHFPGMYTLARKNHLARNLMRLKEKFPEFYKFFPDTWLLPAEYSSFRNEFTKKKPKVFIVKPEASCQGRGIFLVRSYEDVSPYDHFVVQRYLLKPYLVDGLKFDLRIYVLVAGCDPLRIYLYKEGLARFATETYTAPNKNNIANMCMHLTNYAVNKSNPNFIFNDSKDKTDVGHKRSLSSVFELFRKEGHDVDLLWKKIKQMIIKTLCCVQPILAHNYKSCQPDNLINNMCFEVLGLDVILDHKLKPYLLEVNHSPSFSTDTPFDRDIKRNLIRDSFVLMDVGPNNRIRYKKAKKLEIQERVINGKLVKKTPEEKQELILKFQKERDIRENKHLGGFEKIFPLDPAEELEPYEDFMKYAATAFEERTGTSLNFRKNAKRTQTVVSAEKSEAKAVTRTSLQEEAVKSNSILTSIDESQKSSNFISPAASSKYIKLKHSNTIGPTTASVVRKTTGDFSLNAISSAEKDKHDRALAKIIGNPIQQSVEVKGERGHLTRISMPTKENFEGKKEKSRTTKAYTPTTERGVSMNVSREKPQPSLSSEQMGCEQSSERRWRDQFDSNSNKLDNSSQLQLQLQDVKLSRIQLPSFTNFSYGIEKGIPFRMNQEQIAGGSAQQKARGQPISSATGEYFFRDRDDEAESSSGQARGSFLQPKMLNFLGKDFERKEKRHQSLNRQENPSRPFWFRRILGK